MVPPPRPPLPATVTEYLILEAFCDEDLPHVPFHSSNKNCVSLFKSSCPLLTAKFQEFQLDRKVHDVDWDVLHKLFKLRFTIEAGTRRKGPNAATVLADQRKLADMRPTMRKSLGVTLQADRTQDKHLLGMIFKQLKKVEETRSPSISSSNAVIPHGMGTSLAPKIRDKIPAQVVNDISCPHPTNSSTIPVINIPRKQTINQPQLNTNQVSTAARENPSFKGFDLTLTHSDSPGYETLDLSPSLSAGGKRKAGDDIPIIRDNATISRSSSLQPKSKKRKVTPTAVLNDIEAQPLPVSALQPPFQAHITQPPAPQPMPLLSGPDPSTFQTSQGIPGWDAPPLSPTVVNFFDLKESVDYLTAANKWLPGVSPIMTPPLLSGSFYPGAINYFPPPAPPLDDLNTAAKNVFIESAVLVATTIFEKGWCRTEPPWMKMLEAAASERKWKAWVHGNGG